jgi:hypothetical protein
MSPTTNGTTAVLDAMRSIQSESDRWRLAEALVAVVPKGTLGFNEIMDRATKEGVAGKLSVNTLRLYRDAAVRWPSDKRVEAVSFSAHREAMVMEDIRSASKLLKDLAHQLGADKVTVAQVRKAIAVKQGKPVPGSKANSTPASAAVGNYGEVVADLRSGGAKLIAAVPADGDLDAIHAGLTKVIAHVEKMRAAAARKAASAAKKQAGSKAPAKSPSDIGKQAAAQKRTSSRTAAKRGDMRGL